MAFKAAQNVVDEATADQVVDDFSFSSSVSRGARDGDEGDGEDDEAQPGSKRAGALTPGREGKRSRRGAVRTDLDSVATFREKLPCVDEALLVSSSEGDGSHFSLEDGVAPVHVYLRLVNPDPAHLPRDVATGLPDSLRFFRRGFDGAILVHSGEHKSEGYPEPGPTVLLDAGRVTRIKGPFLGWYYPLMSAHMSATRFPGPVLHSCTWLVAGQGDAPITDGRDDGGQAGEGRGGEVEPSYAGRAAALEAKNVGFRMRGNTIEVHSGGRLDARLCDVRSIGGTAVVILREGTASLDECNIGGTPGSEPARGGLDVGEDAKAACLRSKIELCVRPLMAGGVRRDEMIDVGCEAEPPAAVR